MGRLGIILIFFLASCQPYPKPPSTIEKADQLIWVEGGTFIMGNSQQLDAQPLFEQKVEGFWMQAYEVSNALFYEFVIATNYLTLAEINGGSYIFDSNFHDQDSARLKDAPWWKFQHNASWKNPNGKQAIDVKNSFLPVTHIAYEDACAFCTWKGMRLPSEIEREYVAQKDNNSNNFNHWQGNFPYQNTVLDGFETLAPIGSFPAGKLGFYDLRGNVWEWCADPYHAQAYIFGEKWENKSSEALVPSYYDLASPNDTTYVIRGGSYLCAANFCQGYHASQRMRSSAKMTFAHIGFRCVK